MNERIINIVNNNDRLKLDEVIRVLKYDKDPELLKSINDNYTFKLICKRNCRNQIKNNRKKTPRN